MAKIQPENYFALCTGGLIKDLKELAFALDWISDEELNTHVNKSKNDFSAWAVDVFGEQELAEELSTKQDRKDIQIILLKHLINKR